MMPTVAQSMPASAEPMPVPLVFVGVSVTSPVNSVSTMTSTCTSEPGERVEQADGHRGGGVRAHQLQEADREPDLGGRRRHGEPDEGHGHLEAEHGTNGSGEMLAPCTANAWPT